MTKLISFAVTGAYASFRDPSITTNQTVYYIPSKTAIVGMLGAMLGIRRDNTLGEIYSQKYIDFFSEIELGLKLENNPKKIIYFTNHRSEKTGTKPVKKEMLEAPKYRLYVKSSQDIIDGLKDVITNNTPVFSPYLGHAYCPAKITNLEEHDATEIKKVSGQETDCVILDEVETHNTNFQISVKPKLLNGSIIIERHLHHFRHQDRLDRRVLKHWIPIESTLCTITSLAENKLSKFYKIEEKVYCLY